MTDTDQHLVRQDSIPWFPSHVKQITYVKHTEEEGWPWQAVDCTNDCEAQVERQF